MEIKWLKEKNKAFSLIMGEDFTNADVLKTFLGVVAFVTIYCITGILIN